MTKEILVDLVHIRLNERFHKKTIEYNIGRAWNQLMYDTFRKNPDDLDLYAKQYTASVSDDATTAAEYITMPAAFVQLPDDEHIRRISPLQDTTNVFDPVSIASQSRFNNLDVSLISERPTTYIVKHNRVEFDDLAADVKAAGVLIDLVVAFEEYDDDDNVNIPSGKDETLINLVTQFLENTQPDNIIDNDNDI